MTVVPVLKDFQRFKLDATDDAIFYSEPRFVHHLDAGFRARLTALYRERMPPCAQVLDLMSSWVSHRRTTSVTTTSSAMASMLRS